MINIFLISLSDLRVKKKLNMFQKVKVLIEAVVEEEAEKLRFAKSECIKLNVVKWHVSMIWSKNAVKTFNITKIYKIAKIFQSNRLKMLKLHVSIVKHISKMM